MVEWKQTVWGDFFENLRIMQSAAEINFEVIFEFTKNQFILASTVRKAKKIFFLSFLIFLALFSR